MRLKRQGASDTRLTNNLVSKFQDVLGGRFLSGELERGYALLEPVVAAVGAQPFFGTLLGLHRDKRPINHDFDLDFAVHKSKESEIRAGLEALGATHTLWEGPHQLGMIKAYLPGFRYKSFAGLRERHISLRVDFFLYEYNDAGSQVVFDMHWKSGTLLVPIGHMNLGGTKPSEESSPQVRRNRDLCLEYLYGKTWQVRLRDSSYKIEVSRNGVPALTRRSARSALLAVSSKFLAIWFARILRRVSRVRNRTGVG